jgi:hypothetical protein
MTYARFFEDTLNGLCNNSAAAAEAALNRAGSRKPIEQMRNSGAAAFPSRRLFTSGTGSTDYYRDDLNSRIKDFKDRYLSHPVFFDWGVSPTKCNNDLYMASYISGMSGIGHWGEHASFLDSLPSLVDTNIKIYL